MTVPDYRDPRLTEQRNPRTERIDVASTLEIVDLLNAEDATVAGAVRAVRAELARAIDLVVDAFGRGGRLIASTTRDRKSTRLNSSHVGTPYAVFWLKKKTKHVAQDKPR